MKYIQPTFTVPAAPSHITACERCVYGTGEHTCCGSYGKVHYVEAPGIAVIKSQECATEAEFNAAVVRVGDLLVARVIYE
jgi:hypothetical protein